VKSSVAWLHPTIITSFHPDSFDVNRRWLAGTATLSTVSSSLSSHWLFKIMAGVSLCPVISSAVVRIGAAWRPGKSDFIDGVQA